MAQLKATMATEESLVRALETVMPKVKAIETDHVGLRHRRAAREHGRGKQNQKQFDQKQWTIAEDGGS